MKLRFRFFCIFLTFVVAVLAVFGSAYYYLEMRSALAAQRRFSMSNLAKLTAVCREATIEGNWIAALNQIKLIRADGAVVVVDCRNAEGMVLAHSDIERLGESDGEVLTPIGKEPSERSFYDAKGRGYWEIRMAVTLPNRIGGSSGIVYDREEMEKAIGIELWRSLRRILLVSSLTVLLAAVGALFVSSSLTRPIAELVEATDKIKAGDLGYQCLVARRSDELGRLAGAFNDMAAHLAEMHEMRQMFVESITHDLKNPLTSIKGFLELFMMQSGDRLDDKEVAMLKMIGEGAKRLEIYINNLLDYSKLQTGKFPMQRKMISIADIARQAIDSFSPTAAQKNISLRACVEEGVPQACADPEMVMRVLANLCFNALKFTGEGSIAIHVAAENPEFIRVTVRDTGAGIPENAIGGLFNKFYQVEETRDKTTQKGTGLGLTICKKFVEQHGGRIWVKSELGVGTDFIFTLPTR